MKREEGNTTIWYVKERMCLPFLKNAKHKVEDCKDGLGVGDGN